MLIPRFSLLHLLVITTASAVFCYIIAMATRGHQWAMAISLAIGSVLLVFVFHAGIFGIAWLLSLVGRVFMPRAKVTSPFANASPPPQLITPPEDNQ